MSSGSSDYINKIKNETNRIKRRKQKVNEYYLPKAQPEQSSSSPNRGNQGVYYQQEQERSAKSPEEEITCNTGQQTSDRWTPDIENDSSSEALVLQPLDTRGESFSKIDGSVTDQSTKDQTPPFRHPIRNMSNHLQADHEAFRKKLIDDVLGDDASDRVPMEKVVMLIWQYRYDPQVVKFMTRFVAKFAGSRDVFDGIEFYLPQLAHMIIHLEAEWDDAILERFSLVIAQQSLHFALQLNWILQGAIEDYQPELPDGSPNPSYNPLYYSRCIKLLTNIERCVVYRRPRSQELQRLYEKGKISKAEMHQLEQADRRFNAMQITQLDPPSSIHFGGKLMYKRAQRTACYKAKPWKTRYFAIEERMLNCYNSEGGTLKRSMPLDGAFIEQIKDGKYPNMFSVSNRSFEFRMRASSPEDMNKWLKMLGDDANTHRIFGHTDKSLYQTHDEAQRVIEEMTPAQRARYEFFRDERDFIRRLTDIAEDLRFLEPADRKTTAPSMMQTLEVPNCVYSPLCNSTDIFRRIHSTIYKDTRVFNTKERCPVIMYFLGVRGELEYKGTKDANMDIAEYMHVKFDQNAAETSIQQFNKDKLIESVKEELEIDEDDEVTNGGKLPVSTIPESTSVEISRLKDEDEEVGVLDGPKRQGSNVWNDSFVDSSDPTGKAPNSPKKNGSQSTSPSNVGQTTPMRGNRHLKKFLRESFVNVPRSLALHLDREKSRRGSHLSNSSDFHSVPIVEKKEGAPMKKVYVGRTSVMDQNNQIIKGFHHQGEIDLESIDRAKQIVSHGESWAEKSFRMLEEAKNKPKDVQLEVVSLMSKSNDDLRQEVFVMQMIHYYKSVFVDADLPLWLKTYRILSTSGSTGLIQVLVDATSIDGLKKSEGYPAEGGLRKYFENVYGGPESKSFKAAQRNFMTSLAAYSIVSYLLGLKDRHNGNIMIDTRGHLIYIDFGFAMGMAPGHEFSMERAPFKFTQEYVEVMGGVNDPCYKEFERLFVEGFKAARKNSQIALGLVEIMMHKSNYPCFSGWRYGHGVALKRFEKRLMLAVPDDKIESRARALISKARNHWGTNAYDKFQKWSNGYAI
ncbi:phosphatidylinositol 3- and 4-kinase [Nitzschia inconspicua]|uniref:1-phosphatidylinositol 4-kinase n=1 Tax=Nitzschia inconspicua TaxID=303405 RepID=A0A9K3LYA7_9STRA|nr:phosphatidylinositol 3- and 4-kinase [Nitzschia inconspicua]